MSSDSQPITLTRFASALYDLPIDAIYSKHAELRNNITHMESSNQQLEEFARENDDRDCYEALLDNKQVIKRFEERIEALKSEVMEVRGLPWRPREDEKEVVNGRVDGAVNNGSGANGVVVQQEQRSASADTSAQGGNDDEGVFL